jgi:hypothetical protein
MTHLPEDVRYQRTEEFVARVIAGETVLVPIRRQIGDLESIYTLNEVATFIWERLAKPSTATEIALVLDGAFAGDPAEMRTDLGTFLAELLDLGALRTAEGHGPTASL